MIINIITLALCLGMILVFRQIDKDNRSLERVKKFTDKVLADFDGFFKDQKLQAKNTAVELDVKQSQAVAAVKRLEQNIEVFEARSGELRKKLGIIDVIEKRLTSYEATIKELMEMTERVEENLEKIRKESAFIDKFSRQLNDSQSRLADIEKGIPNVLNQFEKQNDASLNTLSLKHTAWVDQKSLEIQNLLESVLDKNRALLEEIQQAYDVSFARAAQSAENLESEAFAKLKEQSAARAEEFEAMLNRSTADLEDYVEREKNQVEIAFTNKINRVKEQVEALQTDFHSESQAALNEVEHKLAAFISAQEEKIDSSISRQNEKVFNDLESQQNAVDAVLEKGKILLSQAGEGQEQLLNAVIAQQKEKLTESIQRQDTELLNALTEQKGRFILDLQDFVQKAENEITTQKEKIFTDLHEQEREVKALLEQGEILLSEADEGQNKKLESAIAYQNEKLEESIHRQNEELSVELNRHEKLVSEELNRRQTQIDASLSQMDTLLETLGAGQEEKVNSAIKRQDEKLVSSLSQYENKLEMSLEDFSRQAADEMNRRQEELSAYLTEADHLLGLISEGQEEKINSAISRQNEKIVSALSQYEKQIYMSLEDFSEQARDEMARRQDELNVSLKEADRLLNLIGTEQEEKINSAIGRQDEKVLSALSQYENKITAALRDFSKRTRDEMTRRQEELSSFLGEADRLLSLIGSGQEEKINSAIKRQDEEISAAIEEQNQYLSGELAQLAKKTASEINRQQNELSVFEASFGRAEHLIKNMNVEEKIDAIEKQMNKRYNEIRAIFSSRLTELKNMLSSSSEEIIKNNAELTTAFFSEIDRQLEESKTDMEYRFERLDVIGSDIDELENNLRKLIKQAEERLLVEFDSFKDGRQQAQSSFELEITTAYSGVKGSIESLDQELNDLKARAYDNVSEKLKVFEDDFFSDLNDRSETLSASLTEWKEGFDNRLIGISSEFEDGRRILETKYTEDIKENFILIQDKYREQVLRLEDNIKKSEQSFNERVVSIDSQLRSFIDVQRTEIDTAKRAVEDYLKAELDSQRAAADEQLKRYERDINAQLHQLSQSVSLTQEETSGSLESMLSDLSSWRERLNSQFEENRTLYSEKLAALQKMSSDNITQVQHMFTSDVEGYANLTKEESARISSVLAELKVQSKNALVGYEERTAQTLEEFKKAYEIMLEDTQRRIRNENADAEQKLRSLKAMVQEVREKNDEAQEKMVLKIQTEANLLTMNMDDIDKRLKQFVAQTQLFDKAEELKNHLENQMGDLRTHISRFDNFKQITDSVELQFSKIRKMDDDVAAKLQRFSAEKNRIDAMETDFNRLIGLSSSMDQKITELKNTSDDLQILQLEVRRFQETLGEISGRYDRLEKKNNVLEQTIIGVDKTFERLGDLESRLTDCSRQTVQMPAMIDSLRSDINSLMERSGRINDVMEKLNNLDTILSETETQVEEVQKAREWISRTEARLVEMTKEAKEQVNLFGALMKGGVSKKSGGGAPPIGVRENVIKLAHQGWKPEQIAGSLNLTIGEIELILDFYGKEGR